MMRSMFAGVSGLKTHQTKMDVIGNNIANVNTVGYKSFSTTFSELAYQNLSGASGANAQGRGGTNAKQIGLGVSMASTTSNISTPGATQTTGDYLDLVINGDSFFVVNDGTSNLFTKAGAFTIDGSGNLVMKSTGYNVQGWQVDANGNIIKNTVSALRIMQEKNLTSPPEPTTDGRVEGVLDMNSANLNSDSGELVSMGFYDDRGYAYSAKFAIKADTNSQSTGTYIVELVDVIDAGTGKSIMDGYLAANSANTVGNLFGSPTPRNMNISAGHAYVGSTPPSYNYTVSGGAPIPVTYDPATGVFTDGAALQVKLSDMYPGLSATGEQEFYNSFGGPGNPATGTSTGSIGANGEFTYTETLFGYKLDFNESGGLFDNISGGDNVIFNASVLGPSFRNITVDFTQSKWMDNGGTSTIGAERGILNGDTTIGAGKKLGDLNGLQIDGDGIIWASYDNGNTVILGQIAVANFPNPSGLEKIGLNCYRTTLNSGDFDGIGEEVSADGGSISSGAVEMSNVDLSSEFTEMITTQRGFQANSRVITTSDSLLEELVNLKR